MKCDECVHALLADFGYSNWTVEGTEFHCMLRIHPDGPFDRFYGKDDRLTFAEQCSRFEVGDPQTLDVDHETKDDLSEEAREYLDMPDPNRRWIL